MSVTVEGENNGAISPQAEVKSPEASSYSWYVLIVLVVVYILNFIDRQILSILAVDIKADLGLTDADMGFLGGAAFAVFYALFGIPLGRLADNWSRVKLLSIGLALWSIMTALSGFARNQVELTMARMGVGVGEAGCTPAAHSLIADRVPAERRASALALSSECCVDSATFNDTRVSRSFPCSVINKRISRLAMLKSRLNCDNGSLKLSSPVDPVVLSACESKMLFIAAPDSGYLLSAIPLYSCLTPRRVIAMS